ncbi:TAP42-like protein [Sporodiniella umbellata]|nr:TAP42-like protein [Sporodiniella umbellata]
METTVNLEGYSLGQLFRLGQTVVTELENTALSSMDPEYQQKVQTGIAFLTKANALVSRLHIFSQNELIDEINTNDLKFLMIPSYIGDLVLKKTGIENRASTLNEAREWIQTFLSTCQNNEMLNKEDVLLLQQLEGGKNPGAPQQRDQKIARHKREKELKKTVQELRQQLDGLAQENEDRDVDEMERDWINYLIQAEIMKAIENWHAIEQEWVMVKEMEIMKEMWQKRGGGAQVEPTQPVNTRVNWGKNKPLMTQEGRPLQPFVITGKREQFKNQVFGPGYNLPTMTIDEYLEQEMERGNIIQGGGEPPEKEEIDDNDHEALDAEVMKKREWDEFTEANPRGAGNRGNKG